MAFIKKNKVCGIYKISSPTNRIYIGKSTNIYARWDSYKRKSHTKQKGLNNSFLSHGYDNHKFEIIEECDYTQLNDREAYWINFYDSSNPLKGMNIQKRKYELNHSRLLKKQQLKEDGKIHKLKTNAEKELMTNILNICFVSHYRFIGAIKNNIIFNVWLGEIISSEERIMVFNKILELDGVSYFEEPQNDYKRKFKLFVEGLVGPDKYVPTKRKILVIGHNGKNKLI